jgi:pimeloyl-ACP methyl ester carboxylesterase
MPFSKTLSSALRALSSVPNLKPDELKQFSDSVDEGCPLPDTNYGADPVWRLPKGAAPPAFFETLITNLRAANGLVAHKGYHAVALIDVDVIVTEPTLRNIVDKVTRTSLTGSEFRLASQLLQGLDLKQAAAADETGYETKRSQFKSLAGKLGLRGQSEVMRVLTTQAMQELAHLAQPNNQTELDCYALTYLPREVRRLTIVTPTGESVRVLDFGPVMGRPFVILHPMFFPPIGADEIAYAKQLGVRLLWPLRPGVIDSSAPVLSSKKHIATSVRGLIAVLEQLIGGPAPLLAFVSSGAVATRTATERPDLVASISFVATCYSTGRSTLSMPYFGAELAELAFRSEAIMTRTASALRNFLASDRRCRSMFEKIFRDSARDTAHLDAEFNSADKGNRLRLVTLQSPESIKHDFFNQTQFSWTELSNLSVPRRFLHGRHDSIHPPEQLAQILEDLGEDDLTLAEDMGHLPHFADFRNAIQFAVSWQLQQTTLDELPSRNST